MKSPLQTILAVPAKVNLYLLSLSSSTAKLGNRPETGAVPRGAVFGVQMALGRVGLVSLATRGGPPLGGCISGCGTIVVAVVAGIIAEALILGSTGGIFGFIVACVVGYELNKTANKENREQDKREEQSETTGTLTPTRTPKTSETTEALTPSTTPKTIDRLVEIVIRPVGFCRKCGVCALWKIERRFMQVSDVKLTCSNCDTNSRLPLVLPENLPRTRISFKPAGHCLKCGKDALWNHTFYSEKDPEEVLICTNCEPEILRLAPLVRTDREL